MGEVKVSVRIPEGMYTRMRKLIEAGIYTGETELVREAIRLLLEKYGLLDLNLKFE